MPLNAKQLKNIIKEGVREVNEEEQMKQLDAKEQADFIQKAKPKYYDAYADLEKVNIFSCLISIFIFESENIIELTYSKLDCQRRSG